MKKIIQKAGELLTILAVFTLSDLLLKNTLMKGFYKQDERIFTSVAITIIAVFLYQQFKRK